MSTVFLRRAMSTVFLRRAMSSTRKYDERVDFLNLPKSEFWNKKFDRAVQVRNTRKTGYISRADFDLVVKRYKEDHHANQEHIELLKQFVNKSLESLGLTDEAVQLTHAQFKDRWLSSLQKLPEEHGFDKFFGAMFDIVNMKGDGFITLDEWTAHYRCYGIDTKYAKDSFNALDMDKDGKISKEHFLQYHYEYFFTTTDDLKSSILYGPLD